MLKVKNSGSQGLVVHLSIPLSTTQCKNVGKNYAYRLVAILVIFACLTNDLPAQFSVVQYFDDPNLMVDNRFGASVAIDDGRLLIGATGSDEAYLFDIDSGNLLQTFELPNEYVDVTNCFGGGVALDGEYVLISDFCGNGFFVGAVFLFDATSGRHLHSFEPTMGKLSFGSDIAIEGNTILIGQDESGAGAGRVYFFDANTRELIRVIEHPAPGVDEGMGFGASVDIDGNVAMIGAQSQFVPGLHDQIFLFELSSGNLLQTIDDPTSDQFNGLFGSRNAIDANRLIANDAPTFKFGDVVTSVLIYDTKTGQQINNFELPENTGGVVDISGDLFIVSHDDFVRIYDVDSGQFRQELPALNAGRLTFEQNKIAIGLPLDDTQGTNVGRVVLYSVPTPLLGDVNGDLFVDLADVASFVDLLQNGQFQIEADINMDGQVDLLDVAPFVDLLG